MINTDKNLKEDKVIWNKTYILLEDTIVNYDGYFCKINPRNEDNEEITLTISFNKLDNFLLFKDKPLENILLPNDKFIMGYSINSYNETDYSFNISYKFIKQLNIREDLQLKLISIFK